MDTPTTDTAPLYQRLLGERFHALPEPVRRIHGVVDTLTVVGTAEIRRGEGVPSRLAGRLLGLPRAGRDVPLRVTFTVEDGREHWVRDYNGRAMVSVQWRQGALLRERLGPVVLDFAIDSGTEGLSLRLRRASCLGLPLPRWLHPRVRAVESVADGLFHFDVEASLPLAGFVVHYRGTLRDE